MHRLTRILVTGGAGFIGSTFVRRALERGAARVVNLDKLTYAGNLESLADVLGDPRHVFVHGDICDRALVQQLLREHQPQALVNFAAETHVDRSIDDASAFVRTNVLGVFELLEAARRHVKDHPGAPFRFLQVSTDEVFGSLGPDGAFTEATRYAPRSPYSASKAGADHLVRAYHETHGLPTLTTHCSNNYGPHQFPEKLIPLMIMNALEGRPLPVYGDGQNVRDWLYVRDHCDAILQVLERGAPGESFNVGGRSERSNLQVVHALCDALQALRPRADGRSYRELITFVADRPGHDRRYAIDCSKLEARLGWRPSRSFEDGLRETVAWYLAHRDWCEHITRGTYQRERLGLEGVAS